MIGFAYNEVSRRYVDDEPEFFVPDEWRGKPKNAKQGSSEVVIDVDPDSFEGYFAHIGGHTWGNYLDVCLQTYKSLLEDEVAPEQARMVLPQNMMTSYYVTGSLAAWARAYNLRKDSHAQKEIQDLARKWDEIVRPICSVSWGALTDA